MKKNIVSPLQKIIVDFLVKKGVSQREFAEIADVSDSSFNKWKNMNSVMGVNILDTILSKFPEIVDVLIDHLQLQKQKNVTSVPQKPIKDMATVTLELDELLEFKRSVEDKLDKLEKKTADLPAVKSLSNH